MTKLSNLREKALRDPKIKAEYDALEEEFTLATTLIKARIRAKLTQEQIALKMQTSQSYIAKIEGGRVSPSIKVLHRYAEATGSDLKISFVRQTH